ncbi:MAG: ATP-dependent Clp protease ATP-binding subunit [Bacteroidales bacterium]
MNLRLSRYLSKAISSAKDEAMRTGTYEISSDHLIISLIRMGNNRACELIKLMDLSVNDLKEEMNRKLIKGEMIPFADTLKMRFSDDFKTLLRTMYLEAKNIQNSMPCTEIIILSVMKDRNSQFFNIMSEKEITYEALLEKVKSSFYPDDSAKDRLFDQEINKDDSEIGIEVNLESSMMVKSDKKPKPLDSGKKNSLGKYALDLTAEAAHGRLDPVVGREKEILRLAQILGRRKKNNPILIGEPGVGKSAIAEGLAIKISEHKVPEALSNKKIFSLDIAALVAGTKFRGQFEERVKSIIDEIKHRNDVILFIDELHTLVGAGGSPGSLDAANMLKPALARGAIQCIGATTLDEYREVIEKDGALDRRFQKILIEPTSYDQTLHILNEIKENYEQHHKVKYSDESLKSCIVLSTRYISDRALPDKAIDLMDEAGSKARIRNMKFPKSLIKMRDGIENLRHKKIKAVAEKNFINAGNFRYLEKQANENYELTISKWEKKKTLKPVIITENDIAEVTSSMTGIPLNKIALSESNKLLHMDKIIKKRIIGQDDAIEKVVKAIRRNRAGLKDPRKPIGSFLFLGPTGVGKTQLAKVLAEFMFSNSDDLIRIDMSEYMEKFAISRLIGAPPGYIGYNEGGQLSEQVRRKPYSVVLLDEVEKAHHDVFNLLLQVLDEGRLTDSNGRQIDFRNTVLIMTSNLGSRQIKEFGAGIGFSTSTKIDKEFKNEKIVEKAVGKTFTPEFLNRLDEQIIFNSLTKSDIRKIVKIELKSLYKRVEDVGYTLKITSGVMQLLSEEGYDSRYGARPIQRAIQRNIEDVVAEAILSGVEKGSEINLSMKDKKVIWEESKNTEKTKVKL